MILENFIRKYIRKMQQYTVHMEWDSYKGSLFKETHTSWYFANSQDDANRQATNQYGFHKGFKIKF